MGTVILFSSKPTVVGGKFCEKKHQYFLINFDPHNGRLTRKRIAIPKKNVGLWLEFVLLV